MKKGGDKVGITETAILTNRTVTHIYNLAKLGRFAGPQKVNGEWKIPREAVMDYLKKCERRANVKMAA